MPWQHGGRRIKPQSSPAGNASNGVRLAACWFASLVFSTQLPADTGTDIYQQGITESGQASIGAQQTTASASLFPCINCHGERAVGSKESGVAAPNITWWQLTQPYRKDLDGGRPRNPYDKRLLQRLLTQGIDSDGQSLAANMPRYDLNEIEIDALITYLQDIARQSVSGVSSDAIHLGLRLPDKTGLAESMTITVNALVDNINAAGGIYGRQLRLHALPQAPLAEPVFAVIDLSMSEHQSSMTDQVTLGIFESRGDSDFAYFLYPHPASYAQQQSTVAIERGWQVIDLVDESVLNQLNQSSSADDRLIAILHRQQSIPLLQLLNRLKHLQRAPIILTDSLSPTQPASIKNYPAPIYLLTPPGPESVSRAGQLEYAQLARQSGFSDGHLQPRLWALTLIKLLTTVLEQSGKHLSQQVFIETLQSQVDLATVFGPLLSYSANRRVGSNSMILVQIN